MKCTSLFRWLSSANSSKTSSLERKLFNGCVDRFKGVTVDSYLEPCPETQLGAKIDDSLQKWTMDKLRCIWFKVYIKDSSWVPILANKGFNFHHARGNFVMMFRGLSNKEPVVPPAIHTNLCVAALVLNNTNQMLVVKEKYFNCAHWKLPGGYANRGEDIVAAAIREVQEETGVVAEFQSLITLRHIHKMMFGNSNIYVFVMLKAITEDISILESELDACQWMNVEHFLNDSNIHEFNRSVVSLAMSYKRKGIQIKAEKKTVQTATKTRDITVFSVDK